MSIQEFYSAMIDLWDQLALTESTELKACGAYIKRREQQRLVQFLTRLLVSYWLKKYVFSFILKRELFLLQILQY